MLTANTEEGDWADPSNFFSAPFATKPSLASVTAPGKVHRVTWDGMAPTIPSTAQLKDIQAYFSCSFDTPSALKTDTTAGESRVIVLAHVGETFLGYWDYSSFTIGRICLYDPLAIHVFGHRRFTVGDVAAVGGHEDRGPTGVGAPQRLKDLARRLPLEARGREAGW